MVGGKSGDVSGIHRRAPAASRKSVEGHLYAVIAPSVPRAVVLRVEGINPPSLSRICTATPVAPPSAIFTSCGLSLSGVPLKRILTPAKVGPHASSLIVKGVLILLTEPARGIV